MPEFPGFVGSAYQAPSIYQGAQECINWFMETDPTKDPGARAITALYPTPGLIAQITSLPAAEVRGMYVISASNQLLIVVGSQLYVASSLTSATLIGSLNTFSGPVSMSDNRISAMIVDGPNRYAYIIATGAFSIISPTDGGFTGGDKVDYDDGFLIFNSPGTNQWGCTGALTTASANLSFSSKDSAPDNLVTLIADHREVYLVGEYTTERWINTGAFPFPFQRIPGTSMQHGCAAKNSIARLGESVAWLSRDQRGQIVVIQMTGYQPKRISTHAVENDLFGGVINDCIAFTYQQEGHEFYQMTFPTQDKTWVYDLATNAWHKRASIDSTNTMHRHRANCYAFWQGLNLVGDYANGIVYSYDLNTYTDNGAPILRMRRTPHLTEGLNRVSYEFLQIQFQPGVGLTNGQGIDPQVMLRWSDDGSSTWSNYYSLPIGKVGAYKNRCIKRQMGFARDRVYEVTISDPVKAVILSADLRTLMSEN